MLSVQDHHSLIRSQYLAGDLQPNNPSHSVVTLPSGSRYMKLAIQSRFLHIHRAVFYRPLIMGPPTSPFILELFPVPSLFHLITVYFTVFPKIAPEEANLPRPYRSILSQHRSSFCSSLHSYLERIELIPSPLYPCCGVEPHTIFHIFSCSSHPTPLTELDR